MNEKKALIPWGWLRAFIFFVAFAVTYSFSSKVREFLIHTFSMDLTGLEFTIFNVVIRTIFIVLLVYLFKILVDREKFCSIGISLKNKGNDILISFVIGAIIMGLGFLILLIFNQLEVQSISLNVRSLILTFIFFFFASIIEEIGLRGYILPNLMSSMNKYLALLVASVVFGLVHVTNPNATFLGIVNLILMGILLGVYYIHRRNLWFPVILHMSWNFFQNPVFGFKVSGFDFGSLFKTQLGNNTALTGGNFGFEGSIVLTIILVIAIYLVDKTYKATGKYL